MNHRKFMSTVSAAALLAALPLPVVMGRAAAPTCRYFDPLHQKAP